MKKSTIVGMFTVLAMGFLSPSFVGAVTCDSYQDLIQSYSPSIYFRLGDGVVLHDDPIVSLVGPDGVCKATDDAPAASCTLSDTGAFSVCATDPSFTSSAFVQQGDRVFVADDTAIRMTGTTASWMALMKGITNTNVGIPQPAWGTMGGAISGDVWSTVYRNVGGSDPEYGCSYTDESTATLFEVYTNVTSAAHFVGCTLDTAGAGLCIHLDGAAPVCNGAATGITLEDAAVGGAQVNCYVGGEGDCFNSIPVTGGTGKVDEVAYFKGILLTDQQMVDASDASLNGCCTPATPTGTPTITPTPSTTPTSTRTVTRTFTVTSTPTQTFTKTPFHSSGGAIVQAFTVTRTGTSTTTRTRTNTVAPTATPSPTITRTFLPTVAATCAALRIVTPGQYVEVFSQPTLSPASFTFAGWMRWDGIRYEYPNQFAPLFNKGDEYGLVMTRQTVPSTGTIFLPTVAGAFLDPYWTWIGADQEWHHVAISYNSANLVVKFYFDGQLKITDLSPAVPVAAAQSLLFGRHPISGATWGGDIDEFVLWNTTLSDLLIQLQASGIYNTCGSGIGVDPVAIWHFDEGSGGFAGDSCEHLYPGTLMGNPEHVEGRVSCPVPTSGTAVDEPWLFY